MTRPEPLSSHRVRGMVVGLALGDTLGRAGGTPPATGALRAGVSTQLAAFTVEGAIRAVMRSHHKGICHPPSVVWHAYSRWAALQGIEADVMRARWEGGSERWPDGWLAQVPVLRERRGSAPSTVAALLQREMGTVDRPTTQSAGCHAITRTLPLGAMTSAMAPAELAQFARDVAALTHGDRNAHAAAAAAALLTSRALTAESFEHALNAAFLHTGALNNGVAMAIDQAQQAGSKFPGQDTWLRQVAPDATALAALRGGIYTVLSFPRPDQVMDALRFAASAPDGDSVATVTGAFLGALHGADALPVELLARHELVWVLDTLARDLVLQLTDNPGGGEYDEPRDPGWWDRYPGW